MSAPLQSATVDALQAVKRALDEELGQVRLDRELLRRLDARPMLERASQREAFNARLHELLSQANACFGALCQAAGVPDATLEGLAVVAPEAAEDVRAAVNAARVAGQALSDADAVERSIAERALQLVRALAQRLPTQGAVYGPRGRATPQLAVSTTRSTAA